MAGGSDSTSDMGYRALCPWISAATPGDRRRLVAETPEDLISFAFLVLGCFL